MVSGRAGPAAQKRKVVMVCEAAWSQASDDAPERASVLLHF